MEERTDAPQEVGGAAMHVSVRPTYPVAPPYPEVLRPHAGEGPLEEPGARDESSEARASQPDPGASLARENAALRERVRRMRRALAACAVCLAVVVVLELLELGGVL